MTLVGRTLGRYHVVEELGRGKHAVVYKAWQPSLERNVALKVLQSHDQKTLEKFQAEARLTAHLIQQFVPNIRQAYEVGRTDDGYLFVSMEYVHDSLRHWMRHAKASGRAVQPARAAEMLSPVADALDAMHMLGWVYLDIKPQNILISMTGRIVRADLGIAQHGWRLAGQRPRERLHKPSSQHRRSV
jgi:serine/threonine-protein kinase